MKNKNWLKKISVLAITGCMMLSFLPVSVYAEPADDIETVQKEVEIPEDAIYISDVKDMMELAEDCIDDDWSIGKTFVLSNDIDMTDAKFYGIPTFGGTFYGQGYTIYGITMEQESSVVGVFRYTQMTAVIDGLNIDATIQPEGTGKMVGGIVGCNAGTIKNCTFTGVVSGKEQVGGIAGFNKAASMIENCTANGIVSGDHYIGGITGENQGVIRQCTNAAEVNTEVQQNSIGMDMNIDINSYLSSFTSKESTEYATNIGGITGTSTGVIRECVNEGNVGYQKMGYNVGGIAGSQNGYIVDCVNYAKIEGSDGVGGIVGQFKPNIVLEFGPDPMETMENKMNSMMSSMKDMTSGFDELEFSLSDGSFDMEAEMNKISESLETLENSINLETGEVDSDLLDSVLNDFSNSFDEIYNESIELDSITESLDISSKMDNMMAQMEDMMSSMDSMGMEINIEDVSRYDKESNTIGKVAGCINYGEVAGENAVGGIAGNCDSEEMMSEEDYETNGEATMSVEGCIRLVLRECKNYGTVAASKNYAGGIAGQMVQGAILSCYNVGNMDALNADYVGNIAGNCDTYILDCYGKGILAGANYVGGIAGRGVEVFDCYAFVEIAAGTEFVGCILGSTDDLPSSNSSLISGNYYYHVGKDRGGIDGVNYKGSTERISLDDFLLLENLDDMFKGVTVRFVVEGQEDIVKTVNVGESILLDEIPVLTVEEGDMYDWVYEKPVTSETLAMDKEEEIFYISESRLSSILFDQTYVVEFEAKNMVSQGELMTEDHHSIILAVGAFDKNTTVTLSDMLSQESVVNDVEVIENWAVSISNIGVEKLHYRIPEGVDGENMLLFVKDADGNWAEREYMIEGSYIVFTFTDGETGFALAETANVAINVTVVFIVVVVIIILLILLRKRKQRVVKKENKE